MKRSDALIIGGGLIGLAIALELHQQGLTVTLLTRDTAEAAGNAAAGMLAPSAEQISPGPMRDLCLRSLELYPTWINKLETLTGINSGYWPCGILAPQLPTDPDNTPASSVLSASTIHSYQAGLSPNISGGHFYPEDAQVDNRALMKALQVAVREAGIDLQTGITVEGFVQKQGSVTHVRTSAGDRSAKHYVLATGAWSQALLPIPVRPRKGQMLSVRVPLGYPHTQPLQRVLFGKQVYIVPRQTGRIILGATVEDVGFTPHNTPAGIAKILNAAIALYPTLQDFSIEEQWWGFRPSTPDEMPILGASPCDNLTLATGHYRNGVLLAPITAQIVASHIQGNSDPLLKAFSYQRFRSQTNRAVIPPAPTANRLAIKPLSVESLSVESLNVEPIGVKPLSVKPLNAEPLDAESLDAEPPPDAKPSDVTAQNVDTTSNMQLIDKPFSATTEPANSETDLLTIAGKTFRSRLMTGTGKFDSLETMRHSFAASESEIVTVAVSRVQTNAPGHEGLADAIDWKRMWMLPNTAGCTNAEEAIRVARLGREMAKLLGQEDNNFVKLEVIPDSKYLLPDPIDTLKAAEQLVKEGFAVLPYINADPLLAKRLEEAGCATVMPLGSPIGSGQGIRNTANIQIIIENANIPVVVDAGIGTPSEAAYAMELGADALLINSAIALAKNPVAMGKAMGMAAKAGRLAYHSGRIPVKAYASASSPTTGTINA